MKLLNRRHLCLAIAVAGSLSYFGCTKKKPADSGVSGAQSGPKIFYHFRTSEEKTLDPMKQFDAASMQLIQSLYDGLLSYHYLKRPYELTPALLEKMPEKQADGTYLLTLRKGVVFHDNECFPGGKGREMTADDVVYSIKRFADSKVNDLSYSLIAGMVEGLDAFREASKAKDFTYDKAQISGLKKIDNYTLTIKFTSDSPLNFYPFAFGGMAIVPHEAVTKYGDDFSKTPVGTGAFSLKSYSRRGTIVLSKNPKYWGTYPMEGEEGDKATIAAVGGKQLPFVDEVQLPLIEETQPQMLKFRKGQLNWVAVNKDDFSAMVDRIPNSYDFKLKSNIQGQFQLAYSPTLSMSFWKFGMKDATVGKNKALRQAIAHAINPQGFIDLMYNGRGIAANSLVPIEIAGSANDTKSVTNAYDPELAKKKLAEAGFPEGKGLPKLIVEFRATTKDVRQNFEYLRNDLAKVGIQVEGNFQTFSNFLQKTNAGNFQVADAGWNADYPDAENFYALLYSPNKPPLPNDGSYENKAYDEIYLKARNLPNGPERFALFAQLDQIIKEDVPMIPLFNQIGMSFVQNNVLYFKRHMMDEYPYKYFDLK